LCLEDLAAPPIEVMWEYMYLSPSLIVNTNSCSFTFIPVPGCLTSIENEITNANKLLGFRHKLLCRPVR
jgi:hypothetical protein